MRFQRVGIESVYHVHSNFLEFLKSTKKDDSRYKENFEMWLHRFAKREFFCVLGMHGKRSVGMAWGVVEPWRDAIFLEGFFVKKKFRQMRFVRGLALELKALMRENKVERLEYSGRPRGELVTEVRGKWLKRGKKA